MNKISKKICSLLVVGTVATSLIGCSKSDDKTSFKGEQLEIGVWGGNDQEAKALDKMINEFEKKTGAKIKKKVYTDYNTQIQADFVAKTAPDTFYVDGNMFPLYSELGVLEPLNKKEMDIDKFYPNLVKAFTKDDELLCVPKDVSTLATYYNKDILKSVNVSPKDIPDSLEEYSKFLVDLQSKLDKKYGKNKVAAMTYNQDLARNIYILEADGDKIAKKDGHANFNQKSIIDNMKFMQNLVKLGVWKTPKDLGLGWNGEAFGSGKAAIMEEGNWVYTTLKNDFKINFGVKKMPTYKGTRYSMAYTVGWGVYKQSDKKDLAKEWIKFATGDKGMQIWCSGAGCLPSRSDVAKNMKINDDPVWKVHSEMTKIAIPWQKGKTIDILNTNYQNFVSKAFKGEEDIQTIFKKIDKQANSEIDKSK